MNLTEEIVWFTVMQHLLGNKDLSIEDIIAAADKAVVSFKAQFRPEAKTPSPLRAV